MEYPYSTSTGSIQKILEKIQTVGQPSIVDKKWFSSIGFSKASEQRMMAILKFIGFADSGYSPTTLWTQFRSKSNGKKILGKALMDSYKELYEIYPDAHNRTREELSDFFSTRTTAGSLALSHTVNTYRNLADFAEFDSDQVLNTIQSKGEEISSNPKPEIQAESHIAERLSKQIHSAKTGVTINLNIQLTVPETTDEKVYDKFFESMKKHLLT